jgi:N-acyl-D-amino-acid deacylase
MSTVYDVLIHGGTIVDGTGGEGKRGSVGIIGDKITYVGGDLGADVHAKHSIDATGYPYTYFISLPSLTYH